MLTEASHVSADGNCFPGATGIYNDEQVAGWKKVVDAVHAKGCPIFIQMYHGGRACHPDHIGGKTPIAPSAILVRDEKRSIFSDYKPYVIPKEATEEDIENVIKQFRDAAIRAKEAGFDGVEIHGAHGYLIDSFIKENSNLRTDKYGGSIENRCKLALEVLDAVIKVYGADRVGIKISPLKAEKDVYDTNPIATTEYLINQFNQRQLAFIEVNEMNIDSDPKFKELHPPQHFEGLLCERFRKQFKGVWIANGNFDLDKAIYAISNDHADLISFGRYFVMNPDVVERLQNGWPL
jgi:N-ethylmaleimide reductase